MNHKPAGQRRFRSHRRCFTLVELIVAGVLTTFILGTISVSLTNLARAKLSSRQRLEAYLRADTALNMIRRDVVSIIRSDDLFWTRFLLLDKVVDTPAGRMDRDEILIFNNRLKPVRRTEYNGEGMEYETQYRIQEDELAPNLWCRRDPLPDEYPLGGGVATPVTDGMLGLKIEAYDGYQWFDQWDSDLEGLPLAVRITVTTSGDYGYEDIYDAPQATLRTIVSLDRILLPKENLMALLEIEEAEEAGLEGDDPDGPPSLDDLGIPGLRPGGSIDMRGFLPGGSGQIILEDGRTIVIDGENRGLQDERLILGRQLRTPVDRTQPNIIRPGAGTGSSGNSTPRPGNRGNNP